MLRCIIILNVFTFCVALKWMVEPGPTYPPTKGEVWPKPQHQTKENTVYSFNPEHFTIKVRGNSHCSLLRSTIDRYRFLLQRRRQSAVAGEGRRSARRAEPALRELRVRFDAPCDEYPHLGMDESYNLTIAASATLMSNSIWGIIRGFETFSQLIYTSEGLAVNNFCSDGVANAWLAKFDELLFCKELIVKAKDLLINATKIYDYPSYSHRGLMLDTSRHFISMKNILLTLEAMSMNKMNVFHWHIVDDQSFPYESETLPELSKRGAYHPSMVYTKADIQLVVRFARERGIRVLPEFDVPGHTRSWGVAYPHILTECFSKNKVVGLGSMNPINNSTYQLLGELIAEVQRWFPDLYYHVGGDEVDLACWRSNPALLEYMTEHNMTDVQEFHALFMTRVISLLGNRSEPIVWQEVFDENVVLSPGTLVQVWKGKYEVEMNKILESGHKVLFSSAWYLDHLHTGGDWEVFYNVNPRAAVADAGLARGVVGGEACMWGEVVDDRNVISRVWPRASAVAEVLWSSPLKPDLSSVRNRLEEHTCRMIRRDIAAQPPNSAGFCIV